jgi:hypothetical protein
MARHSSSASESSGGRPDLATPDDVIVAEHVECDQKGFDVSRHTQTMTPFAMSSCGGVVVPG